MGAKRFPSFMKALMAGVMTLSSSVSGAGPASDARDQLNAIRETAKATAMTTLTEVLGEVVARTHPLSGLIVPLGEAQEELNKSFRKIRAAMDETALASEDMDSLVEGDTANLEAIDEALDRYTSQYEGAQIEARRLLSQFRSAQARLLILKSSAEKIRQDVIAICRDGIAVNVDSQHLPHVQIKTPQIQLSFSAKTGTDEGSGTQTQPGTGQEEEQQKYGLYIFPIFDEIAGKEASEYNAAASYTTAIGLYAAFGGFAATTTTAALMAGLAAGGVTIVIAAALFAIQDSISRQKATEAANAVERVFWSRADAMTVAEEMRSACVPILKTMENIPAEVESLGLSEPAATAKFEKRRQDSKKFLDRLRTVSIERAAKMNELKHKGLTGKALVDALEASPEGKEHKALITGDAAEKLGESLAVEITDLLSSADRNREAFLKLSEEKLKGAEGVIGRFMKSVPMMRDRLWRMNRLRMEMSLENQGPGLSQALRQETLAQKEAIEIYRRWQHLYGDIVYKTFMGRGVPTEQAALVGLLGEIHEVSKRRPGSALLKLLERRTHSLLKVFAGAK